jgi:hypothetical protein
MQQQIFSMDKKQKINISCPRNSFSSLHPTRKKRRSNRGYSKRKKKKKKKEQVRIKNKKLREPEGR